MFASRSLLLLASSLACYAAAYNIAIFGPTMAGSQIIWNKRVADELADAGHKVTVYALEIFEMERTKIKFDPRVRVKFINGSYGLQEKVLKEAQQAQCYEDLNFWDAKARKAMSFFGEMYRSCEVLLNDEAFLKDIVDSNYDVAFTHMYNFCPIGIIYKTKIPSWIWLNSGALLDNVATAMGVPIPPSYCAPALMDAGDKLNFIQRTKSFIGSNLFKIFLNKMTADPETEVFRKKYGVDFPHLADLAAQAPLVMVNSNELYDFPRPTLAKIVNIGGVGMKTKLKNLTNEYATLVNAAKDGHVVMTYGSHAPMYLMPDTWRDAFFNAFAQFPNIQFFIRHEKPDEIKAILPKNVHASKWLPQTDLLYHTKCKGLISHGGYNSLQDVIHAGVPILATALFGDQFRNANLAERLGLGINMRKPEISESKIAENIRKMTTDKNLKDVAVKLRAMVESKPVSAETLLVKWTEFLAQHKNLDNLVPVGASLPWYIYHSLDVIVFLGAIVLLVLTVVLLILRTILRCSAVGEDGLWFLIEIAVFIFEVSIAIAISVFCGMKIVAKIKSSSSDSAVFKRRAFKQLFIALIAESAMPIVLTYIPAIGLFCTLIIDGDFEKTGDILFLITTLYPVVEPIVIIGCIPPYRARFTRLWEQFIGTSTVSSTTVQKAWNSQFSI